MLDARSQYQKEGKEAANLELGFVMENGSIPIKSEPRVHKVWIHAFEMETGDYFWGGFMSLVTESDRWVFAHPESEYPYEDFAVPPSKSEKAKPTKATKGSGKRS